MSKHRKGALTEVCLLAMRFVLSDSVLWFDEDTQISNVRFFSLADLVVTVNSSVGFEALYFDKTVVVLGDAVYKPKDMFPSLDDVLSEEFNRAAYLEAAGLLRRFMLGGYLQPRNILQDASIFCQNLGLIHNLTQNLKADPIGFVSGFWRSRAPSQQAVARSAMIYGISKPMVGEFGNGQTLASPAEKKAKSLDVVSWENGAKLPLASVNRIKAYWLAEKTMAWIKEKWASDGGRSEVVKIGGLVDPDYYLGEYPDVKQSRLDSVQHYAVHGISDGRSPQSKLSSISQETVFSLLVFCAKQSALGSYNMSSDTDLNDNDISVFRTIFDRLQKHVSGLDIGSFFDWLSDAWLNQKKRANVIRTGGLVDTDYYLRRYADIREDGIDPIQHYAFQGVIEGRSPSPGIEVADSDALLALLQSAVKYVEKLDQSSSHYLPDDFKGQRSQRLKVIRGAVSKSKKRIAVVVHLYYTDLVSDFLDRLGAIAEPFDLVVTMPDWGTRQTVELVRKVYPEAIFYDAVNRGRDILDPLSTFCQS